MTVGPFHLKKDGISWNAYRIEWFRNTAYSVKEIVLNS
jgi:hypothetical protein